MQARFVRQTPYSSKDKPTFVSRTRLRHHVQSLLVMIRTRRIKCSRSLSVLLLLALAFSLFFFFLFRPFASRSPTHSEPIRLPAHPAHIPRILDEPIPDTSNQSLENIPDAHVHHSEDDDHIHVERYHDSNIKLAINVTDYDSQRNQPLPVSADQITTDQNIAPDNVPADEQPHVDDNSDIDNSHADSIAIDQSAPTELSWPDPVRQKYADAKMSIVVLFHSEYGSLNTALTSWVNNRLIDYADEIIFFLNGVNSVSNFQKNVPLFESKIPEEKRRLELSPENLPLGLAITRMVELAKHDYVLLLEKDWELIENEAVMQSRLADSKILIGTGVAHVVRHRHRHNPGVPLHALIMHQGREESIMRQQPNLLCYAHHWQSDPTAVYPGAGIMTRCGGPDNHIAEKDVFCSASRYCNWSNNPAFFEKKWFMDEVGTRYRKEYGIEKKQHGSKSPFLDFEYYTNWRSYAWTDKNFTVALGTGLFRHAETEHQNFNTFWYAHYRLTVDLEELRTFYLRNETKLKKLGGKHYDTDYEKPPNLMQRYPVDFVRKFQWEPTFTGTLAKQREAINKVYEPYLNSFRVNVDEWNGTGPIPPKGLLRIDWRGEITKLHQSVEKAMMLVPPEQPHEMSITLVTTVLDIGRDGLEMDAYQFKRDFKMYMDAMKNWLTHKYKKVVYTSKEIADELMKTASEEVQSSTKFVYISKQEIADRWLGPDNFAKVQEIRKSNSWRDRASWLAKSPQAGLEYYNPLVMSKMFMMRDAARENFWNTTHFLFIDSKHNCQRPDVMTPLNDHILRAHMFDKFLLTTFDYEPNSEVHGFEYEAFNSYCNMESPHKKHVVRVGRGGIFGGSGFVLEFIAAMYDVALTATLREGLMGTEENIMSIVMYNVRQYVDEFSNNWACPDNLEKDHKCSNIKSQGSNCAIFEWVARDAVLFSK